MPGIKAAIIGGDGRALKIYRMLKAVEGVEVLGLADPNMQPGVAREVAGEGVLATTDIAALLHRPQLDVVLVTAGDPGLKSQLYRLKPARVAVVEGPALELVLALLLEREKLLAARRIKGELEAVLSSVQEAIEVVDARGTVKYVNPAFTRITGIAEKERIGANIFKVSPQGALATALRTGRCVSGYRTRVGGSGAEVISNAAPIIVDGKIEGAVVVFQDVTEVMKLLERLQQSAREIECLSAKFGQVTNSRYTFKDILGKSGELRRCLRLAERAAATDSTVLLLGETGTGKELFAHAIHHASARRNKPFIRINCAAIPENLLESEFFGYEKGAFTGADRMKMGKLELAHGGTIFLDEVGDLSPALQGKLLRVLQDMEFERVGGNQTIKVDVRVIAATNRNLKEMVRQGGFREDLYYRLGVVEITIPPLRMRKEDLPLLVNNFIAKLNRKLGKKVKGLTEDAEELLLKYDWPGNVRELENVLERVMLTADEEVLDGKHFAPHVTALGYSWLRNIEVVPLETMEKLLIAKALAKHGTSTAGKMRAAEELKISLSTLYNKLKKYRFGNLVVETG